MTSLSESSGPSSPCGLARPVPSVLNDPICLTWPLAVLPKRDHGVLAGIGIVCFRVNKTCGVRKSGETDMS